MIHISRKVVLLGDFDLKDYMQRAKCKSIKQIQKEVF